MRILPFQLVIANMLQTRKNRVIFVTPTTSYEVHLTREQGLSGLEIEEPIVADIVHKHEEFMRTSEAVLQAQSLQQ